jgi:hypothetical protein
MGLEEDEENQDSDNITIVVHSSPEESSEDEKEYNLELNIVNLG